MNDKLKAILWGLLMGVLALWIYDRWGRRALNSLVGGGSRPIGGIVTTRGYGAPGEGDAATSGNTVGSGCVPKCGGC